LCFDACQILLLHVQSKQRGSKAALQPLHDSGHKSARIFRGFLGGYAETVGFPCHPVVFCTCIIRPRQACK
jgi:hypothetical protein